MKLKTFIPLLLATSLMLMVVALYSGFGLTESDTGAYIYMGIRNTIPIDRSIFYGWFIRYTSMWSSLWYALFAQNLLLAYVLLKYVFQIQNSKFKIQNFRDAETGNDPNSLLPTTDSQSRFTLFTVITIVSFTCVSWVASYLMPDAFAGILLLSILLFFTYRAGKALQLVAYALIILLAMIVHNSHALIVAPFSLVLIVWAMIKKHRTILKRSLVLLSLSAMSWLLLCTVNAVNGYDFTYSRGSHVFMVTKFAETGILKTYLDDNCGTKNLKMCNYRDQIPAYSWDFLWDAQSPLYKTGGWDSNKKEFGLIIHDVFTTPKYMEMFMVSAATGTLRELSQVQAPDYTTFQGRTSSPGQSVSVFFADELNEYVLAKQNTTGLSATSANYIYYLFFLLSVIWILFHSQFFEKELFFIYGCILLFFVLNAFVTSTFSTVIYRFQNRVFWALPATNAILMIRYYWYRFPQRANTE